MDEEMKMMRRTKRDENQSIIDEEMIRCNTQVNVVGLDQRAPPVDPHRIGLLEPPVKKVL